MSKGVKAEEHLGINPGSEQVRYTIERDGQHETFEKSGATICSPTPAARASASGRARAPTSRRRTPSSQLQPQLRQARRRQPNTHAFVASPEMVAAHRHQRQAHLQPVHDTLTNDKGEQVKLAEPTGWELPPKGFAVEDAGYQGPPRMAAKWKVVVKPDSQRLQLLEPFPAWNGRTSPMPCC
jgi:aconitate hydratase